MKTAAMTNWPGQFLFCRKAQIAVFNGLDGVIQEADDAVTGVRNKAKAFLISIGSKRRQATVGAVG